MAFWHPFADMGAVSREELIIDRGEGPWVFDEAGTRYLDATASLWYANLGHGRAEIADAVAAQMKRIEAYHTFSDLGNRPANEVCERLAARAPMPNAKVFLTSGGGDSIEVAAKLARRHFVDAGQPERVHLISRTQGYHGTHGFGTSLGGIEANVVNWGPLVPQTSSVPLDSLPALEEEIRRVGPDKVAAFFCEPVIGAGGVHVPPDGYIQGAYDLCAEHGILFVCDSVICAFGRLGTWFGIERWPDVKPAMITFAKGVTSGYLPLGGVVVSEEVAAPLLRGARRPDVPPRRDLRRPSVGLRGRAGDARDLRARGHHPPRPGPRAAAVRRAGAARPSIRPAPASAAGSGSSRRSPCTSRRRPRRWPRARAVPGVLVRAAAGRRRGLSSADLRAGAHRAPGRGDPRRPGRCSGLVIPTAGVVIS